MFPTPPRIALTMGDPCGIGPELWVRILSEPRRSERTSDRVPLALYGDEGVLARAADRAGCAAQWQQILRDGVVTLRSLTSLSSAQSVPGQPNAQAGAAQVAYLQAAVDAAVQGDVHGLCTAPIHKAWAKAAGLAFPGHTELLGAHLRAAPKEVMMLAGPSLRVALATTHVALRDVADHLGVTGLADTLVTVARALKQDFGIAAPRLWVAGLNPHAGEDGHFGREEADVVTPAMQQAAQRLADQPGTQLVGPLVPDALFRAAVTGPVAARPDAVVAMYHDQGLIPLKLLDFDQAVNVTLGLRIVRTSPDHGVAYDIAGQGLARPDSQRAALDLCIRLTRGRQQARDLASVTSAGT